MKKKNYINPTVESQFVNALNVLCSSDGPESDPSAQIPGNLPPTPSAPAPLGKRVF